MVLILHWLQLHWNFFWTFSVEIIRPAKLQNSDIQSHFSMSKIIRIFPIFFSLENINLGAQLLSKTFFDSSIFKNNLFLKWCCQILIFAGLITLAKNVQKSFQCNFCNQWNISFILKSFYQIPLTWSKTYSWHVA